MNEKTYHCRHFYKAKILFKNKSEINTFSNEMKRVQQTCTTRNSKGNPSGWRAITSNVKSDRQEKMNSTRNGKCATILPPHFSQIHTVSKASRVYCGVPGIGGCNTRKPAARRPSGGGHAPAGPGGPRSLCSGSVWAWDNPETLGMCLLTLEPVKMWYKQHNWKVNRYIKTNSRKCSNNPKVKKKK